MTVDDESVDDESVDYESVSDESVSDESVSDELTLDEATASQSGPDEMVAAETGDPAIDPDELDSADEADHPPLMIERPEFSGRPTGIRRGDADGRLVIDATAGKNWIFGFHPDLDPAFEQPPVLEQPIWQRIADGGEDPNRMGPDEERILVMVQEFLGADSACRFDQCRAVASLDEAFETVVLSVRTDQKFRIVTLDTADHGDGLVGLSAGGNLDRRSDIGPLVAGFTHVDGSLLDETSSAAFKAALGDAVDDQTAAIVLPAVATGSGGRPTCESSLRAAREVADQFGLPLIIDHCQTVPASNGSLITTDSVRCDAILLSAGLLAGHHGAIVLWDTGQIALRQGRGEDFSAALAAATLSMLSRAGTLADIADRMHALAVAIAETLAASDIVEDIDPLGASITLRLAIAADEFDDACRRVGLVVDTVGDDAVMLTLPLNLSADDQSMLLATLAQVAESLAATPV